MADCEHCKNGYYVNGFLECKKDLWSEGDKPCKEYNEYTSEDAYWEKYNHDEAKRRA